MYPHIMNIVKLCNTKTLQCSTMTVYKRVIDLTADWSWEVNLAGGHLFSRSIRFVLALFCCQFIIAAHCKTDLKYSCPDIS